eukprot:TRINITY_DN16828_c0_g1_i1.p1 TRINITY_DN16828_c0_g1~~TRINITY_DN16828_c0_g1_i1.p1  ORF type:complete len:161 (-),score=46.53 TRINITY_DN16828_c0_g1_i1:52-534(-)
MSSPFIFLHETSELSMSLNPHEKTHGFEHPWWEEPQFNGGQESQPSKIVDQEYEEAQQPHEPLITSNSCWNSIEEGRTFILLAAVIVLVLIIFILIIWIKRMKNSQHCPERSCNGSLPDYDTATEMKVKDVELPTYKEAAEDNNNTGVDIEGQKQVEEYN